MEPQQYISLASVALAALIALLGGFRYITAQVESLRREITSSEEKARLQVEKAVEGEAKNRLGGDNAISVSVTALQQDMRQIQREAVRHEQMDQLEGRMHNSLSKIEGKVDKLAENAGEITAIKQSLAMINSRLERLVDRLDPGKGA